MNTRPFVTSFALLGSAAALLYCVAGSNAQPQAAPSKQAPAAPRIATIEMLHWHHDDRTGIGTGDNIVYREADTTMTGDRGTYNQKQHTMDIEGSLTLDDAKHHATGARAHVDNGKTKLAIITGSVVILLKPSGAAPVDTSNESAGSARSHGVVVHCDRVEDYYKRKYVYLRGNLVFHQHITKTDGKGVDRTMTAEHAEYDESAERLQLFAPVKAHDTENHDVSFEGNVIVGTREGAESLETQSKTTYHIPVDEDEGTPDGSAAPTPKTPAPKKPAK